MFIYVFVLPFYLAGENFGNLELTIYFTLFVLCWFLECSLLCECICCPFYNGLSLSCENGRNTFILVILIIIFVNDVIKLTGKLCKDNQFCYDTGSYRDQLQTCQIMFIANKYVTPYILKIQTLLWTI